MSDKGLRQFAPFVLLSVLVHVTSLWFYEYFQLWNSGREAVRVRFEAARHYTFTLRSGDEGVGLDGQSAPRFGYAPEAISVPESESDVGRVPTANRNAELGGKEEWQSTSDQIESGGLGSSEADTAAKKFNLGQYDTEDRNEQSELFDLLAFDVDRHVRTTAVIDRTTGKLKKAVLYLPCYRNYPEVWEGGRELGLIMAAIEGGHRTPDRPPIVPKIDYIPLGIYDPQGDGPYDRTSVIG